MNLIRLSTGEYPRSLWQLRAEHPNVSFPRNPSDEELAPYDHANVHPVPAPEVEDPRLWRAEDTLTPVLNHGRYEQSWLLRETTAEERAAWDANHQSEPRWLDFSVTVMTDPAVNAMLASVLQAMPGLYAGLTTGLNEASKGDAQTFLHAWHGALGLGLLPADLAAAVQDWARERDLPEDFIAALWTAPPAATEVGQEWTAPDGTLWRVAQDRDAEGKFLADDPNTEARESLIWVKAETLAEA